MFSYLFFINLFFIPTTLGNMKCSNDSPFIPKYYLMEKCNRSKLGVVAQANYSSLASCHRLGVEKKALAINFSPPEAVNFTEDRFQYTCEALICAEVFGGVSLSNDSRFDYYSLYAKPLPDINATCVPATGMFRLQPGRLNYTQAAAACANKSGMLADVSSEQRTEALAQVVAASALNAAFVGMRRHNSTTFINTNGDSLDCSAYRAWAPGHPRKQFKRYDCAVLTRTKQWRSAPCKETHPALCELIPSGPYTIGSIFPKELKDYADNNMTFV